MTLIRSLLLTEKKLHGFDNTDDYTVGSAIKNKTMPKQELLFKELSEKIISSVYSVFNQLEYGHPEKVYQKAFELELIKSGIQYKRESYSLVKYDSEVVGRYFLDFLIDDKIAIEFKVRREIYESDWIQLLNYLKAKNMKVGLLIVITKSGPVIKRIVN